MDFKQLRTFLTVAESGNVTRAAQVLHLVQPAVSRHLQLLEADLGVRLFGRERHGMVLTAEGKALIPYARRALDELVRARRELDGAASGHGAITGIVTLGLLPSTTDVLACQLVQAAAVAYPGIRLRISMGYAGTLLGWVESGEVDAALLYGVDKALHVTTSPLIEEPLWLIGPKSAKLRKDKPVALASLAGKALVLPGAPHGIRTLVEHACAKGGVELTITAETNALSVQRSLVLGGIGLTVLPPIAVADDLAAARLSGAPLGNPTITRTIVLAQLPLRPKAHVTCVVQLLVQCARGAVQGGAWPEARWLAD